MNNRFVLQNLQNRLRGLVNSLFTKLSNTDRQLFELTRLLSPEKELVKDTSVTAHISEIINRVSVYKLTVVVGFLSILRLITGSSIMKWNTTG